MKKLLSLVLALALCLVAFGAVAEPVTMDKLTLQFVPSKDADVIITGTANLPELVKAELADTVASRVEECGVQVLSKPVAKPLFDQALRFSMATRRRMLALQEENQRLEKKLAELRLVDRAKCVLIQYLGMTEEQAHRQIEKQAMDTRQTKAAIARAILATYEM